MGQRPPEERVERHDDNAECLLGQHSSADAVLMLNTGPEHGEDVGSYRGDPLYHASLAPSEYAALVNGIGFDVIEHAVNEARAGGRTVWLCRGRASS